MIAQKSLFESVADWAGLTPKIGARIVFYSNFYESRLPTHLERFIRLEGLTGWMRSTRFAIYEATEIEVEGRKAKIDRLISYARSLPGALVRPAEIEWKTFTGKHPCFRLKY